MTLWHTIRNAERHGQRALYPSTAPVYMDGQASSAMGDVLRWYRRLSLRARFAIYITVSTVVVFATLVPAVVYLERRAVLGGAWERGLQLTKVFAHASVQGLVANDFLAIRYVINSVASEPDVLYAMIVDPSGKILAHSDVRQSGQIALGPLGALANATEIPIGQEILKPKLGGYEFAVPVYVSTKQRAVARVGFSLKREMAEIEQTRNLVIGIGVLALIAGLAVSAWQARSVTQPLAGLVRGARTIAAGDFTQRIPRHGADEVAQLGEAFNQMAGALQARITELERVQAAMVRSTRLAAIGEIAAAMAHETRNPLGAISSCAQIMRKHAGLDGESAEMLDIIKSEADRLNTIVSDFLAYGRPRSPIFQPVDLHELLDEAVRLMRRDTRCGPGVKFDTDYAAEPISVRVDPNQMRQVFLNLLINAVQAMSGHGVVTLETRESDDAIHIGVRDTGCGISEADMTRLFEPFQTLRAGGVGLGLATVRRIVEDHGGRVSMRSALGVGTRVLVTLPLG